MKFKKPLGLIDLKRELARAGDTKRAGNLAWFFKTGKGEYGYGDKFLDITVPVLRRIAKHYLDLPLAAIAELLASPMHEHRSAALEILVAQYFRGEEAARRTIFDFYVRHTASINNWDLVDASAPYIVGEHLVSRSRRILYRWAKSRNLWERRIAMVATLTLIRRDDLKDTFAIAKLLLADQHDLIHKATGWMLREAGKRSQPALLDFLKQNYAALPRTTLRYAIERLPERQRKAALKGVFR